MSEKNSTLKNILASNNPVIQYIRRNGGIIIGFFILCVIIQINTPQFLTWSNIVSVLRQISTNLYLASAITMILIAGGIDLSAGAVVSLSSVVVATCMVNIGLPIPLAILCAVVLGALIGFVNGTIVYKTGLPPFIVTYSMQCICQGIAYVVTGAQPIRLTDKSFIFLGTGFVGGIIPMPLVYLAVILLFVWYVLNRTKLGRHIYATGGNEKAAEFSGVNIKHVRWFVYSFSGIMAALAGVVLSARMYSGQPAVGADAAMDAIASVVLGGTSMAGGRGFIGGTIIGALLIGVMNNGLNLAGIDSYWQMVAKGIIILIAVYVDFVKQGKKLRK
ncbi:MAG: ABC transporter permease [Erysipelotrichaceae bacterium]|nr:ABC transporter permease [Erysipelotrichaceae bacterium]